MFSLLLQFSSAGFYKKGAFGPRKYVVPPVGDDNSDVELEDDPLDDSDLDPDYVEDEDLTPTASGKNKNRPCIYIYITWP